MLERNIRPREKEVVAILEAHAPLKRAEVARMLGCAPATAGQHLWLCRSAGLVHRVGFGCAAVWYPGPAAEKPAPVIQALHQLHQVWR